MANTKRVSISYNDRDTDFIHFLNFQHNASLSIRIICQKWISEHGIGDVIDIITTQSTSNTKSPLKQNRINNADSDLNDDIFNDL